MLRSLQTRFALSHLLPILFLLPLLGLGILNVLDSESLIPAMLNEGMNEGRLIGEAIQSENFTWDDPLAADGLVKRLQPGISAHLSLYDSEGRLLASSLEDDERRPGQMHHTSVVATALSGVTAWGTLTVTDSIPSSALEIALPIFSPMAYETNYASLVPLDEEFSAVAPKVIGVIDLVRGMNQDISDARSREAAIMSVLLYPLLAGIFLAIVLALVLAHSLASPLIQLETAMIQPDFSQQPKPLMVNGPTQIRNLESRFNEMSQQLFDMENGRRHLLAGVVHELGHPISAIKLAAQYLERYYTKDAEATLQMISDIDDQTEQLCLLLEDLVLLAKSAEGKLEVDVRRVRVTPILNKQLELLVLKCATKQISVSHTIQPDLPPVPVDPLRFTQIISNLLDNANKYTSVGGKILFSAWIEHCKHQSRLVICVADNGPGISSEEQEKIFKLFYRSPNQAHFPQGMGIGLALSRQLAEAQGGQLVVESQPGKGSKFFLSFPLASCLLSPHSGISLQ